VKNRVVIGGQWGDEGKGKIVDSLSSQYDWVARYQGGANAGHTIMRDDQKIVLHLIPSGLLHDGVKGFLGGGMVVDPWALKEEIIELEQRGISVRERLVIASNTHLILPYHKRIDELSESKLKRKSIGTTGRGIGPAYMDKIARTGIRMGDLLLPPENLERKVIEKILVANEVLASSYDADPMPSKSIAQELVVLADIFRPMIASSYEVLSDVRNGSESIMFEGAQGVLLDIDHGSYPFVTSSSPTISGAISGTGLPPRCMDEVTGIFKAYCTRVGNGPFPTEILAEEGEELRSLGGEFGATTGRPRRCGWFDLLAARYAVDINGMTGVIITKLDVLDTISTVKVAVRYECGEKQIDMFQTDSEILPSCKPVYKEFSGWEKPTTECRALEELPSNARKYLEFLEKELGTHIIGISVGKGAEDMIWTPEGVLT
jgi:adenylosuccinate synthase